MVHKDVHGRGEKLGASPLPRANPETAMTSG